MKMVVTRVMIDDERYVSYSEGPLESLERHITGKHRNVKCGSRLANPLRY